MKVFYLFQKIQGEWFKKEVGVFDWEIYLSNRDLISLMTKTELIGYSKYGAYLYENRHPL